MEQTSQAVGTPTATVTVVETSHHEAANTIKRNLILRIRQKNKQVKWSEETVDNEHMGKKSSKRCCIYHKKKNFGESDSDETDSDEEKDKQGAQPSKSSKVKNYQRFHA